MDDLDNEPVYCMHCERWYVSQIIYADKCTIGSKPVTSKALNNSAGFVAESGKDIYGKPSKLNRNHNCAYYRKIGIIGKISRRIFLGIPMRPTIESKVE
jgi:hypothetical protein